MGRRLAPAARAGRRGRSVCAILLLLGLVYPYAGGYARTGGYANSPSLDGLKWLESRSPGDPGAIDWLREHTAGDAVVLEAFGDDYSRLRPRPHLHLHRPLDGDGLGRPRAAVAAQPRHPRRRHQDALHDDRRPTTARALLDRYGISYVVVGPIEQTTYGDAGVAKWDQLGEARLLDRGHDGLELYGPS